MLRLFYRAGPRNHNFQEAIVVMGGDLSAVDALWQRKPASTAMITTIDLGGVYGRS